MTRAREKHITLTNVTQRVSQNRTAAGFFGAMTDAYDSLIRRAVKPYDEMLARLVEYLPSSAGNVLELGCGTGNLTVLLAERWPDARLSVVDSSQAMIAETRQRLMQTHPDVAARCTFITARFEDLSPPNAAFDVVTSSLSLHHVRDKATLYRSLRPVLRLGGQLVFADEFRGVPDAVHQLNWAYWIESCRQHGVREPELRELIDHRLAHDHYGSVSEHVFWLSQACFGDIDCVWREYFWGVLRATAQ